MHLRGKSYLWYLSWVYSYLQFSWAVCFFIHFFFSSMLSPLYPLHLSSNSTNIMVLCYLPFGSMGFCIKLQSQKYIFFLTMSWGQNFSWEIKCQIFLVIVKFSASWSFMIQVPPYHFIFPQFFFFWYYDTWLELRTYTLPRQMFYHLSHATSHGKVSSGIENTPTYINQEISSPCGCVVGEKQMPNSWQN
jgi:hypothetical protein